MVYSKYVIITESMNMKSTILAIT